MKPVLLVLALLASAALFGGEAAIPALPPERYLLPVVVEDVPGANGPFHPKSGSTFVPSRA